MFGTLLGSLPRPALEAGADLDTLVRTAIAAQDAAGLEPVSDGGLRRPDLFATDEPQSGAPWVLAAWTFAASCSTTTVKQALPGPYTLARRHAHGAAPDLARDIALALRGQILELIANGCGYIEVHEPDATLIGADPIERQRYAAAHAAMLEGVTGAHVSLVITGGNADDAGAQTILAPGYHSLAVDLIAGPDNWRLVTAAPGSMGIVCGALPVAEGSDDGPEALVWATRYAASTGGRGLVRVGLATASDLDGLSWAAALRKLDRLGAAARIAGLRPGEELAHSLDHRSLDLRTRAVGHTPKRPDPGTSKASTGEGPR